MKIIKVDEIINQAKYWVKQSRECATVEASKVYTDMALQAVSILSYVETNRKYHIGVHYNDRPRYYSKCYRKYYEMIFE